ncbi:MAG: hypothetical protein ACOY5B_06440 [Spirochaetota bacterium]
MRKIFLLLLFALACKARGEQNVFSFCRDFSDMTCREPLAGKVTYSLEKSMKTKTMRDFWNSVYFRGDRLAFEIRHADARRAVDFDCLYGNYYLDGQTSEHHELEYIELKEKNVYGLVMLGSLLEKRFTAQKNKAYVTPGAFTVTYSVFCRNDLLARASISVEMR